MPSKSEATKKKLILDGVLEQVEDHLLLKKDTLISSSSYAAALVAGSSRSGPQSWKTSSGETLKALEERLISTT